LKKEECMEGLTCPGVGMGGGGKRDWRGQESPEGKKRRKEIFG